MGEGGGAANIECNEGPQTGGREGEGTNMKCSGGGGGANIKCTLALITEH